MKGIILPTMDRNCLECSLLWERYYRASSEEFLAEEQLAEAWRQRDHTALTELAIQASGASERTFLARLDITNHQRVH